MDEDKKLYTVQLTSEQWLQVSLALQGVGAEFHSRLKSSSTPNPTMEKVSEDLDNVIESITDQLDEQA